MVGLLQELRHAVRSLSGTPGITVVVLVTLALGIGATTSIYSVADAVLFSPLPYPDPERLVRVYSGSLSGRLERGPASGADFLDWKAQSRSFEILTACNEIVFSLVGREYPRRIWGAVVTPDFFDVLGVEPALGRALSPGSDGPGSDPVAVLSHGLWQSEFDENPSILGAPLRLGGDTYTVVGVMPPGFDFPNGTRLWVPARGRVPRPAWGDADAAENRGRHYLSVYGRLGKGIGLEEAQAEMSTIGDRLALSYPDTNANRILVLPLHESMVARSRPVLYTFLGAVGFLLLIACANVANLLLVRAARREREIAIRSALGAGRRILLGLLAEGVLLSLAAGALGILAAMWGTEILLGLLPGQIPLAGEIGMNVRVLGFTLLVTVLTGTLFGLVPGLQLFAKDMQSSLREGGTAVTAGRARTRLRRALIVGEVAVSVLLLVGAALMMRTFMSLTSVDPGFSPDGTLAAHVVLPSSKYRDDAQVAAFYREVLEGLRAVPGISTAGAVFSLPLNMNVASNRSIAVEGRPYDTPSGANAGPIPGYQVASRDYFRALGIPVLRGRAFTDTDVEGALPVAIISERLAEILWPGQDPIGRRVTWDDTDGEEEVEWVTVIGIVGNTVHDSLAEAPRPEIYRPYRQAPIPYMTLVMRGDLEATALVSVVRQVVKEVDPEQPISGVMTMERAIASSLDQGRFNMQLLGAFALAALALSGLGLYGVISFTVSQRSREIGIRKALGAQARSVIGQVLREGLRMAAGGVVLGALGGLLLTRLISGLIHGVSPLDPASYGLATVVLLGIALLACYVPAARAARIDPVAILRQQ